MKELNEMQHTVCIQKLLAAAELRRRKTAAAVTAAGDVGKRAVGPHQAAVRTFEVLVRIVRVHSERVLVWV